MFLSCDDSLTRSMREVHFHFFDTDIAGALKQNPFGQWQVVESLNLRFPNANLVVLLVVLSFR